jgi:hypothetical protein
VGLGVANDEPDQNDTMGRVLRFRSRGETAARLIPRVLSQNTRDIEGSPIGDLAKYEQAGDGDDFGHRMRMNAAAIVVLALLVAAGVWIANTMAEMQKNQDCVLQGRRNCAPIDVQSLDRR